MLQPGLQKLLSRLILNNHCAIADLYAHWLFERKRLWLRCTTYYVARILPIFFFFNITFLDYLKRKKCTRTVKKKKRKRRKGPRKIFISRLEFTQDTYCISNEKTPKEKLSAKFTLTNSKIIPPFAEPLCSNICTKITYKNEQGIAPGQPPTVMKSKKT